MDLTTGAMGSLLPKLVELVKDEYKLQTGVKKDVESLSRELRSMRAALRKVGEVPRDQLDEQVVLWADDLRELSYDMEDIVDKFLVRVEGADSDGFKKLIEKMCNLFKKLIEKMCNLFKKGKTRHQIADAIEEAQEFAANQHKLKQLMKKMGMALTKGTTRHQIANAIKDINKKVQEAADNVDKYLVRVEDDVDRAEPTNLKNKVKKFLMKTTKLFSKGKAHHHIADAIEEAQEFAMELAEQRKRYELELQGSGTAATIEETQDLTKELADLDLFSKGKALHQIAVADAIKDMKDQVQDVAARRDRYKIDYVAAKHAAATVVDPRLKAMYKDVSELVGIDGKRDHELIKLLSEGEDDDVSKKKLKIASIVGFGGLGKTTLARAVYDKIKGGFDCSAFVPVGRKPDAKKVFRDILLDLNYTNPNLAIFDERQLINELQKFLENKRYLIVIDDIWDEKLWGITKCAFPDRNGLGSRLITTTRNFSVSRVCCSSEDDIYEMKPLSDDDSKRLFYRRVFQCENECPSELEQVSRDILKKCGGVPLAIITIASLLASDRKIKPKDQWIVLLNSIGRGLTEGASVKNMKMILSLSYYDLPSHLKTCLLYLSIFPEDYEIERERLIWRWIAEGFVWCYQKQETSLFEIGESYFNELINRSMIQPVYDDIGGVESCRVHDMMLDLICSLSSEENFVTILDGTEHSTPNSQSKVRRLSLQGCKSDQTTTLGSLSTSQVRSVTIFEAAINLIPPLSNFDVLRILDLRGFNLGGNSHINLRDVASLSHLRYLNLARTGICELPAEIGKLQFLQVLDVRYNYDLKELPYSTVVKLRRLMCLRFDCGFKWLADGLGNLASLEVLEVISASLNIVKELCNLTRLRQLHIYIQDGVEEAFVESLCKLQNLQNLFVKGSGSMDFLGKRWVPPPHLRRLVTQFGTFSALPAWIKRNPSHLSNLTVLSIKLKEVQQEDLRILGRLPALRSIRLDISVLRQTQRLLLIDGFPCTVAFRLYIYGAGGVIMFQPGALPSAERVWFSFSVRAAKDEGIGDFDLGLGNLHSLRDCLVHIYPEGATVGEAKEAEAALRHAAHVHPNHPRIHIDFWPSINEGAANDDIC